MSHGAMLGGILFGGLFHVSWPSLLKRWVEMWCHISHIFQHPFGSGVFACCVRNVGGKRAQETLALHFTLYRKFWFYIPFLSGSAKYTTLNAGSPGHKRALFGGEAVQVEEMLPFYIQFVLHDVWGGRGSGNDFLWPCPYYSCGSVRYCQT